MRLKPVFWLTGANAVLPVAAVALLWARGDVAATTAMPIMAAAVVGPCAVALVLVRDLHRLGEHAACAASGRRDAEAAPRLRLLAPAWHDIDRLASAHQITLVMLAQAQRSDDRIIDLLPDPLLVVAADRTILRANEAARDVFGADLPSLSRHPALLAALDQARGATQTAVDARISIAVPVPREILARVVALDRALPGGGAFLVVLSDRTYDRALERMRSDFVANASHELRTPLASIIGFIETLRGPARDDEAARIRFLSIMAEQAARMNRLIDDLLSLSRIELTEHRRPSASVDLGELVTQCVDGFEPRLTASGTPLETAIEGGLPPVAGDADQLIQVLQNLIENALKYGKPRSPVRVAVRRAAAGERWPARPGAVVSVTDQGIGIARDHLPRLTERFYRVDKGRSRAVGGTGLGLAIVKHIVNRHRGVLTIDSEEGQGTCVSVWLPFAGSSKLLADG
jgi:two-component system phosphate regulon sensor histidine kinase PhoR